MNAMTRHARPHGRPAVGRGIHLDRCDRFLTFLLTACVTFVTVMRSILRMRSSCQTNRVRLVSDGFFASSGRLTSASDLCEKCA